MLLNPGTEKTDSLVFKVFFTDSKILLNQMNEYMYMHRTYSSWYVYIHIYLILFLI